MDLLKEPIGKLYLKFLLPSLFSALVTTVYSFVDTIAIGQGVGQEERPDGGGTAPFQRFPGTVSGAGVYRGHRCGVSEDALPAQFG